MIDAGPATLDQIAEILGVTKERVRQIEFRALQKIGALTSRDGPDERDMLETLKVHYRQARTVLELLRTSGGDRSAQQIADQLRLPIRVVRDLLERLAYNGLVRVKAKRWSATRQRQRLHLVE